MIFGWASVSSWSQLSRHQVVGDSRLILRKQLDIVGQKEDDQKRQTPLIPFSQPHFHTECNRTVKLSATVSLKKI